jgi:hypothetical protein
MMQTNSLSAPVRVYAGGSPRRSTAALSWANWNAALLLLIAVLCVRLLYLAVFSPYQLVGDEAYYWEQARHLDWCYNEKGPALAWLIAACCRVLGDSELAVRLPVALCSLLAGWGIGRLAMHTAGGDERVGFFAVLCFCLIPAFAANAQICTQDGPMIAVWVALSAIGLRLVRQWRERRSPWRDWMLFWLVLGIGFLFKQSVLLFLPGLAMYWFLDKHAPAPGRRWLGQQAAGAGLFLLIISPMIYWNYRHGWPILAHTLGHLGAGGDQAGQVNRGNPLTWLLTTVGGIAGAAGAPFLLLAAWACHRASHEYDPARRRDQLWLICAAAPGVIFFVLLSFIKPVVASWPLPALVPLVPLVAELLVTKLDDYRGLIVAWRRRMKLLTDDGVREKKPETRSHQLWVALVAYGVGGMGADLFSQRAGASSHRRAADPALGAPPFQRSPRSRRSDRTFARGSSAGAAPAPDRHAVLHGRRAPVVLPPGPSGRDYRGTIPRIPRDQLRPLAGDEPRRSITARPRPCSDRRSQGPMGAGLDLRHPPPARRRRKGLARHQLPRPARRLDALRPLTHGRASRWTFRLSCPYSTNEPASGR